MRPAVEFLKTVGVLVALWGLLASIAWFGGALPSTQFPSVLDAAAPQDTFEGADASAIADAAADDDAPDAATPPEQPPDAPERSIVEAVEIASLCAAPAEVVWAVGDLVPSPGEELVVACQAVAEVVAWPADASAPMRIARLRFLPGTRIRGLAVGDVDADGRADVVVATGEALQWVAREPTGGFSSGRTLGRGSFGPVVLADFDAAPGKDIAVVRGEGPRPELWVMRGGPTPVRSAVVPAPLEARALVASDVDTDGHADVIVAGQRQILLAFGDSTGSLPRARSLARGARDAARLGETSAVVLTTGDDAGCLIEPSPALASDGSCRDLPELTNVRDLLSDREGAVGVRSPAVVALGTDGALAPLATLATTRFGAHRATRLDAHVLVLGSFAREDGSRQLALARAPIGATFEEGALVEVRDAPLVLEVALPDPEAP